MERNPDLPSKLTDPTRRSFLSAAASSAMGGGLLASYGVCAGYAGRYLYPARDEPTGWMYVAPVSRMKKGDSMQYRTPAGAAVSITRCERDRIGQRLHRAVEHLSPPWLPGALGAAKQPLFLPVPQRCVRPNGKANRRAARRRRSIAARIRPEDRCKPLVYQG